MNSDNSVLSLGEAARRFLAGLSAEEMAASQQEVYQFVRWYGADRPIDRLTAPEVGSYAEKMSLSDTDYARKLELVKAFLVHARKEGWTSTNLAIHLKPKKGKTPVPRSSKRRSAEPVSLSRQSYTQLEADVAALKAKRPKIIEEVRKAAADKDFRENAPLEAARQEYGQLEGRIRELEGMMKSASIINDEDKVKLKVNNGDTVVLADLASGEELRYKLVSPREVDPAHGKISNLSPIGKAIMGKRQGETVEVTTPGGKLRYQVKQIEH